MRTVIFPITFQINSTDYVGQSNPKVVVLSSVNSCRLKSVYMVATAIQTDDKMIEDTKFVCSTDSLMIPPSSVNADFENPIQILCAIKVTDKQQINVDMVLPPNYPLDFTTRCNLVDAAVNDVVVVCYYYVNFEEITKPDS